MRLIYTDEAGTSAQEPVCVVATVIVEGDEQSGVLESEISRIISDRVPSDLQKGFHIHATDIFSGKKIDKTKWDFQDRLDFLKELICLPFVHDAPIAVGIQYKTDMHRDIAEKLKSAAKKKNRLSASEFAHFMAFTQAMERSDYFIRKYLKSRERGMVLVESHEKMDSVLAEFGLISREINFPMTQSDQRKTRFEKEFGLNPRSAQEKVEHILDVPYFVKKGSAPLLQLADLCAFAFRRCLAKLPQGDDLLMAMLGPHEGPEFVEDEVWFEGPSSSGLFNTFSFLSPDEKRAHENVRNQVMIRRALGMIAPTQGG